MPRCPKTEVLVVLDDSGGLARRAQGRSIGRGGRIHPRPRQKLTTRIIEVVAAQPHPVAFLLWGRHAQCAVSDIPMERHVQLSAAHPSPLSAKGFLGKKPFSTANAMLRQLDGQTVDWTLEPDG